MLLNVKNNIQEIDRILPLIHKFCGDNGICEKKCFDISIIIDELATNVINYAFSDDKLHEFTITLRKIEEIVHIEILDEGIPFDPLKRSEPDIESSLEDRKIGGLGIYLARQLAEKIIYTRIDNKNKLDIFVTTEETIEEEV